MHQTAVLKSDGTKLDESDAIEYERNLASARAQMEHAAWQVAWAEGQAMSMEQAIAYALEETEGE